MTIERISVGAGGVQGNGASGTNKAAFSADDRFVVFESSASNLVAGDTNGVRDIFLLDRSTGQVSRVSTSSAGAQAGAQSFDGTISADGKYVFYRTFAAELSGQGATATLIRKEIATGQIDVGPTTHSGDANDILISASADGRYVLYTQPGGNGGPIARYDFQTGQSVQANVTADGQVLGSIWNAPSISADGRFALFYSNGAYVVGDQATYDTFIKDLTTGEIIRASSVSTSPTIGGNADSHDGYISGNGKYAVFSSAASNLVSGDTNGINDVYRVDLTTREVVLVSSQADGSIATGPTAGTITSSSDDGRFVVFNSRQTNLVAGDTNGFEDIFVKDVDTGRIMRVSVAADGTQGNGHSHTPSISHDGRFVTFTSEATNLVAGDTNGASDVFLVDLAESGFWQAVEPTGTDVQVNTTTEGDQYWASGAALGDGGFVVLWQSRDQDGDNWGVYGQRYDAGGVPQGSEFIVNTTTTGAQLYPSVTPLNGGGFFVTWTTQNDAIYGQRFDSAGAPQGVEILINTSTAGIQELSAAANLVGGGFVVTWTSNGSDGGLQTIYAQRFSDAGDKIGGEFRASDTYGYSQPNSAVTGLANGGFVITWTADMDHDGSFRGIYGRIFDHAGTAQGSEFRLNTTWMGEQATAKVAAFDDGGFVAVWMSAPQDGSDWGIYGQRFDSTGNAVGGEFRVNSTTFDRQIYPAAVTLADGGFLVTWSSQGQDGSGFGVYGQYFDPSGVATGTEFRINEITAGDQSANFTFASPGVIRLANGNLVQTWSGQGPEEVFFRLLSGPDAPVCFLAGTMIRTPAGEAAVESLVIGDRVMTADGRALPVKFIGRQTIVSRFVDAVTAHPILIEAGALDDNVPARDLYTSPGHAMVLGGTLVIAGALVNGSSIRRMAPVPERFTYFHIELDEHAVIFAEGAETESYCNNVPREIFDNAAEYQALYGEGSDLVQLDLPTVKSARQLPAALRSHLLARAHRLASGAEPSRSAA